MYKQPHFRFLSLLLAAVLVLGLFPTAAVTAAATGLTWEVTDREITWQNDDRLIEDTASADSACSPTDLVRVSILLEDTPTLRAGFSTRELSTSAEAAAYDLELHRSQKSMERRISAQALGGQELDVVWNLTLVSNIISANVPYGKLDAIRAVEGVRDVVIEQQYTAGLPETDSAVSTTTGGASALWQTGLTGAGSRIAIIDTGTDTDHQSFDNGAFLYSLRKNAEELGMEPEVYLSTLELLDADEIAGILEHLNAYERIGGEAAQYYINEKLPFAANYVDYNLTVDHDHDGQGSHGSHVAGIAAANRYIPDGSGYADSLSQVFVCGVAPDAQIITLKVFGNAQGPSDSDYFAAIEDAIWLGCDSINLSLGTGSPGSSSSPLFADLLEYLATTDTVVVTSAGNSGTWADSTEPGYLYSDGVSLHTAGAPSTYTNTLSVASVENDGAVGSCFEIEDLDVVYTETLYHNNSIASLDTSYDGSGTAYDYIFIDGFGTAEDYAGIDLFGKVVFCSRGSISFAEKASTAAAAGAAALVVYNNDCGTFYMDLTDYYQRMPCVSITGKDAAQIREASEPQTTASGVTCYTGSMVIGDRSGVLFHQSEYDTLSTFSSWGVPGSLELKPEIAAPGGMILSVNGMDTSGTGYEVMSGTSMAAPQISGMVALVSQYIQEKGLTVKTGQTVRQLAQSLLMSTAEPMKEAASGGEYYSILGQGAGQARVDLAVSSGSYVLVEGMTDGKVKAELGEDPDRTGIYEFSFTIHDISGRDTVYSLSADLFTQDIFDAGDGTMLLDTWTTPLSANTVFTQNGVSLFVAEGGLECDLNGDGITSSADADHLLEYLVGNSPTLYADGDVDGDGTVTSHDAHALLSRLTGAYQVRVPAGGSATVRVRMELTAEAHRMLQDYPTGAYIEAFVYAAPAADEEGSIGVTHSIPVLGYYGSWTEPSMYDAGSYAEYMAGTETRTPYLYYYNNVQSNFVSISQDGRTEYLFGGNPYTEDEEYLPQRNAFNNTTGWRLQNLHYTLIRSAAASMLVLENADTGEIYLSEELGQQESAYYHVNSGVWQNTRSRIGLGLGLEDIPEGTRLNLHLICAPELYCTYDPISNGYTADYDALAGGAYLTTSFTIDNTSPVIRNAELLEGNVLRITAGDNQYIAAAALLDKSGSCILSVAAANQTAPGGEVTIDLDLNDIFGSEFLVAVFDYARNEAVCAITLELDTQRPYFTALDCGSQSCVYTGIDSDGSTLRLASSADTFTSQAAEYAEGAVFEISQDGCLYAAYDENLCDFTPVARLDPDDAWRISAFCDMAYNRTDGKLYALFYSFLNNQTVPYLASIDPHIGSFEVLGAMPEDVCTIAIDGSGNFYSTAYGMSRLYRYTADVTQTGKITRVGQTQGYRTSEFGSLAWDHNTDSLYWAFNSGDAHCLLKLDPSSGSPSLVCSLDFSARGLYIAYETESDIFAPTGQVLDVRPDHDSVHVLTGCTAQLTAQVLPWNISDSGLIWESSDPTVAAVDENGLVTGISDGEATITAASVLDSSGKAEYRVLVTTLNAELKSLVWDEEGQVFWSSFTTNTLPAYNKLAAVQDNLAANATMMAEGTLYCSTLDTSTGTSHLYTVDPASFEMTSVGSSSIAYLDMTYAPSLGCGLAVYFDYIVLVDLHTGDYKDAVRWIDRNGADLVGITYYGSEYNSSYGADMDYFLLLDADGNVYLEAFLMVDGLVDYFYGPGEGYIATIGEPVDYSYFQGFHYDGSYVYWTRFNEADNMVELIVWNCDGAGEAYSLGCFPEGVWPVGGLYTDEQLSGTLSLTRRLQPAESLHTPPTQSCSQITGSLHQSAPPEQEAAVSVTVAVPADAAAPTNGTLTVTYDPQALELVSLAGSTEAFAWRQTEPGSISIAFADRAALSVGTALAELRFLPLDTGSTWLRISYDQWNRDDLPMAQELSLELPKPYMPFADVPEDSFYYDPVLWAISNGITNGATDTTFAPTGDCLRAAVVTFLWRASGCPEPTTHENPFSDVKETDFFYKAVLWAVEMGITNGTSATTFSPYQKCNRAQVVTFLWRAMGKPAPASADNPFTDVDVNGFYGTAVLWAVEAGITNGMGDGTFGVGNTCNRAQVVTFLYRTLA